MSMLCLFIAFPHSPFPIAYLLPIEYLCISISNVASSIFNVATYFYVNANIFDSADYLSKISLPQYLYPHVFYII